MSWFFVVGEWWLRRSRPTLPISRRGYRVTLAPCTSTVPFQWSTTHNSSMNCSAIYIILSISVILRNSQIGRLGIQYVFTVNIVLQCITVNILHLSVYSIKRFWWNAAYADLSTLLNTMQTCQFKNMPIQIHVNSIKNYFLPIIVHAKYKKFAVSCNHKLFFILWQH